MFDPVHKQILQSSTDFPLTVINTMNEDRIYTFSLPKSLFDCLLNSQQFDVDVAKMLLFCRLMVRMSPTLINLLGMVCLICLPLFGNVNSKEESSIGSNGKLYEA